MDVGRSSRQLRKERRKSTRSLATLSGLSTNALSMIERDHSSPSVSTFYKLSEVREVPNTALFWTEQSCHRMGNVKSEEWSLVASAIGVCEGLERERFIWNIDPFMLTLESQAASRSQALVHSGYIFVVCLHSQLEYSLKS